MHIVASDGYIIDIFGPYLANGKNNDAVILNKHLSMKQCNNIFKWSQSNDVFVLDRGFRDFLELCSLSRQAFWVRDKAEYRS